MRGRARGFTLLELMVVIAILAVAAVLVGPRFAGAIESVRLQAATRDVASALRAARTEALRERRDAAVLIDVDRGLYQLSSASESRALPEGTKVGLVAGGADISSDSQGRIVFFPDGSSSGGRISLANNGRQFRVDVNWLTGRVRILDDQADS
ncbi:GspH/FimT family pseudopilin [Arhodomonas sp. AD133]|uniref:GspH/FimT family pseudopilin n=1 Tax=Arhodomonas sp. AD133 TaxID=3415009 RepID=UPI003EB760F2